MDNTGLGYNRFSPCIAIPQKDARHAPVAWGIQRNGGKWADTGFENPRVGGSNPPPGTTSSQNGKLVAIASAVKSRNICSATKLALNPLLSGRPAHSLPPILESPTQPTHKAVSALRRMRQRLTVDHSSLPAIAAGIFEQ